MQFMEEHSYSICGIASLLQKHFQQKCAAVLRPDNAENALVGTQYGSACSNSKCGCDGGPFRAVDTALKGRC
jgi:hypothetical protein